jgi:hypothetical protein
MKAPSLPKLSTLPLNILTATLLLAATPLATYATVEVNDSVVTGQAFSEDGSGVPDSPLHKWPEEVTYTSGAATSK